MNKERSTVTSRIISASRETLYRALTDPIAIGVWLAPGAMTGKVHSFDLRVGGGYQMSLYYPSTDKAARGKTSAHEDRFTARFVELRPPEKIVQAINFESDRPEFAGEMIMEVSFEARGKETEVTFLFTNIPPGIKPEDNDAGTRLTLEKLASYVE
jgi:uncharacterized protein YndB with AHSA1/START domain